MNKKIDGSSSAIPQNQTIAPSKMECYGKLRAWIINKIKTTPDNPWYTKIAKVVAQTLIVLTALVFAIPTLGLSLFCLYDLMRAKSRLIPSRTLPQLPSAVPPKTQVMTRQQFDDLQKKHNTLNQAQQSLLKDIEAKKIEINRLSTELQRGSSTITTLHSEIQQLKSELTRLKQKNTDAPLQSQLSKKEQELAELEKALAEAQTQASKQRHSSESLLKELEHNEKTIASKQEQIDRLTQQLQERDLDKVSKDLIAQLQNNIKELTTQKSAVQLLSLQKDEQIKNLEKTTTQQTAQITTLNQSISDSQGKLKLLTDQYSHLTNIHNELIQSNTQLEATHQTNEETIHQLNAEITENKHHYEQDALLQTNTTKILNDQIFQIQLENTMLKTAISNNNSQILSLQDALKEKEQAALNFNHNIEQAKLLINEKESLLTNSTNELKIANEETVLQKQQIIAQKLVIDNLENRISQLGQQLEANVDPAHMINNEILFLKNQIASLNEEKIRLSNNDQQHQNSIENLQIQISNKTNEVTNLQQQILRYKNTQEALELQHSQLEKTHKTLISDREEFSQNCTEKSITIRNLETKLENLRVANREEQHQLQDQISLLNSKLEDANKDQQASILAERSHLESIKTLEGEIADLKQKIEEHKNDTKNNLNNQIELKTQLSELEKEYYSLSNKLKEKQEDIDDLNTVIDNITKQKNDLKNALGTALQQNKELKEKPTHDNANLSLERITELQSLIQQKETVLAEQEARMANFIAKYQELEKQYTTLNDMYQQQVKFAQTLELDKNKLQQQVSKQKNVLKNNLQQTNALKQDIFRKDQEIKRLHDNALTNRPRQIELEEQTNELYKDLTQKISLVEEYEKELNERAKVIPADTQQEIQNLNNEKNALEESLNENNLQISHLQSQLHDMQLQLNRLQEEKTATELKANSAMSTQEDNLKKLESIRSQKETLETNVSHLKKENQNLSSELEKIKDELAKSKQIRDQALKSNAQRGQAIEFYKEQKKSDMKNIHVAVTEIEQVEREYQSRIHKIKSLANQKINKANQTIKTINEQHKTLKENYTNLYKLSGDCLNERAVLHKIKHLYERREKLDKDSPEYKRLSIEIVTLELELPSGNLSVEEIENNYNDLKTDVNLLSNSTFNISMFAMGNQSMYSSGASQEPSNKIGTILSSSFSSKMLSQSSLNNNNAPIIQGPPPPPPPPPAEIPVIQIQSLLQRTFKKKEVKVDEAEPTLTQEILKGLNLLKKVDPSDNAKQPDSSLTSVFAQAMATRRQYLETPVDEEESEDWDDEDVDSI